MHQVLADVEHHLQFRFKKNTSFSLSLMVLKKPLEFRGAFLYSIKTYYALFALCFFAFGSEPNGLFLAKSTNTGAATKIEE